MAGKPLYSKLIEGMLNDASVLRTIAEHKIGEIFPISDDVPIEMQGFTHEQTDFMGYGQKSATLDNSFGAYEVIAKIQEILFSTQTILESIYPAELQNGSMTVQVGKNFNQVIESIKSDMQLLLQIKQTILQGQKNRVIECIDLSQIRKLRDHFVVLGYEISKNDWNPPQEFLTISGIANHKQEIKRLEQAITPQIASLANQQNINQIDPLSFNFPNSDNISLQTKSLLSRL